MDEIKPEDLPNEGLIDVAMACGMEVVKSLIKNFPGQSLPVPQSGLIRIQEMAAKSGREKGPFEPGDIQNYNWQFVAQKCGIDVVLSLFEHAQNITIVIPKNPLQKLFHRYAVKHYDPVRKNSMEVALALGISRSHFFDILNEPSMGFNPRQNPGSNPLQMRLV